MNRLDIRHSYTAFACLAVLGGAGWAVAADLDHSQHRTVRQADLAHEAHQGQGGYAGGGDLGRSMQATEKLAVMPPSGAAREAGSDNMYTMEPTSARYDLAVLCAQGSRGMIMLDNETWKRCGGKPKGASRGPGYYPPVFPWYKEGKGESQEMDHSKMGH